MGKCTQPKFDVIHLNYEQEKNLDKDAFMKSATKPVEIKVQNETEMEDIYIQERKGSVEATFPFRGAGERSVYVKINTSGIWKNSRFFEIPRGATRESYTSDRYYLFSTKTALDILILPGNAEQKKKDAGSLKRQDREGVNLPEEGFYSISLPVSQRVLSVTYGHYNKDGLTDLKLELAMGAIILQQREDSCQEKPKPKVDPKPAPKEAQKGRIIFDD